jgi:6-pyruvoyltetrahydropterin/6-carboxytetrahydropterin synthase
LIGGDWGPENERHAHPYKIDVELHGETLDEHGYLVDIVEVEGALEDIVDRFNDRTLNDLPEFQGLNPSIEHFSRIVCEGLLKQIQATNLAAVTVRIWESDIAWASYQEVLSAS